MSRAGRARTATTRVLRDWQPPTARQAEVRDLFLHHLATRADGLLRSCRPDHVTASVLVLSTDADQVLLTLHAKAAAWFQLGGHVEPTDAGIVEAAAREAHEESGLAGLRLDPVPVHLDVHPVPFCGEGVRHLDVRFVAVPDALEVTDVPGHREAPRVSEESHDVRWWPVDALPGSDLAELVRLARARVLGG
jgi:8-oxo-dGTP pyrophosphatase MutT (NUDIX family)